MFRANMKVIFYMYVCLLVDVTMVPRGNVIKEMHCVCACYFHHIPM